MKMLSATSRRLARPVHLGQELFVLLCLTMVAGSAQTVPSTAVPAASQLPLTQPTAQPTPPISLQGSRHAKVSYTEGLLAVSAHDSSLNQILRQVSQETGMKVTGGVTEERVFGEYGPGAPSQVLTALLEGTGSNMLLLESEGKRPSELVLTPRMGGASPPNPNAPIFNEQPGSETSNEPNASLTTVPAASNQAAPIERSPAPGTSPYTGALPAEGAQPESPNGVKTPQQIFDQLQRMRQQGTPPQQ